MSKFEDKEAEKKGLSYPHRKLNSPSQYTPKGSRRRDKVAVRVFMIICRCKRTLTKFYF